MSCNFCLFFSIFLFQKHILKNKLHGEIIIWTLWVVLLGFPNWKMTLVYVNVSVDVNLWGFLGDWTSGSQRL
jgi:hypothetical protein